MKVEPIDLDFVGAREVTAALLLLGETSAALVETGPSTSLESLVRGLRERGVSPPDVQQDLLGHVHLDHAGASGHLAGLLPNDTRVSPCSKQRRPTVEVSDGRVQKGGMVMNPWIDLEPWRKRSKDLLREAEQQRLARELREARRAKRIEVRLSLPGDEHKIAALLELNSRPRWEAFEERFIVAEEEGKILAALPYQTTSKRLWVGLLITDPWVEERSVARALYAGLGDLARDIGVGEILAQPVSYTDYPYEAGYLRCGPWWWLDATRFTDRGDLLTSCWRRVVGLLRRAFRH